MNNILLVGYLALEVLASLMCSANYCMESVTLLVVVSSVGFILWLKHMYHETCVMFKLNTHTYLED